MSKPSIIRGLAKGKKLKVPKGARPVTARMKRSIFDTLGDLPNGSYTLDLFAGSGSFGIEALSRGADFCEFVDHQRESLDLIGENLKSIGLENKYSLRKLNAYKFLKETKDKYDLIFCDPPFDRLEEFQINKLRKLLHEDSVLVIKYPTEIEMPDYVTMPLIKTKSFGESQVGFYQLGEK